METDETTPVQPPQPPQPQQPQQPPLPTGKTKLSENDLRRFVTMDLRNNISNTVVDNEEEVSLLTQKLSLEPQQDPRDHDYRQLTGAAAAAAKAILAPPRPRRSTRFDRRTHPDPKVQHARDVNRRDADCNGNRRRGGFGLTGEEQLRTLVTGRIERKIKNIMGYTIRTKLNAYKQSFQEELAWLRANQAWSAEDLAWRK